MLYFLLLLLGLLILGAILKGRDVADKFITAIIYIMGLSGILVTVLILFVVGKESIDFFRQVPVSEFLFSKDWMPISMGSIGIEPSFGALSLIIGTLLIALIAIIIATPIGVLSAVAIEFYICSKKIKKKMKLIIELMAGVPSIVYGFFAVLVVSPVICFIMDMFGIKIEYENAISVGLVMAMMIIPTITMICVDTFANLPKSYLQGALAMGANIDEAVYTVLIPAARPGIIAAIILAFSRAIGETMLVVMALSLSANFTLDPTQPITTITVQIVSIITGDQSFDSPVMLSAFALGLLLFVMTFVMNAVAIKVSNNFNRRFGVNA